MTLNDVNLLVKYQREKNGKLRKKILESGKLTGNTAKLSLFIEALGDPDIDNKVFAINVLGDLANPEALKPLMELTQYRLEIKEELISAIVKIVEKCDLHKIIPTLLEFDNLNVKKSIPLILGRLPTKESKKYLMEFLSDRNPIVRKNAVKALKNKLEPSDIEHIIGLVDDENQNVKIHTMAVLGQIGNRIAIKSLVEYLKDENEIIRNTAERALYKILKREDNLRPLYSILAKRNKVARREAVRLIGMLKKPEALNKLIRLLNSRDNNIRRLASGAIVKILRIAPEYTYLIRNCLNAKEWQVRKYSAIILGQINDKESIELLFKRINDSKSSVRRAVAKALAIINPPNLVNIIKPYLINDDWRIRRSLVNLLGQLGSPDAIDPLINCLNDRDIYVRSWAVKALGEINGEEAIYALHEMLKNDDPRVRLSAAKSLRKKNDRKTLQILIQSLGDDDFAVRREIEKTLDVINPDWMSLI